MRRSIAVICLVVASILACSSPAPEKEPKRVVGNDLPSEVADGGKVPLEAALAAFVRVFGPLPGVAAPAPDGTVQRSGTGALRWVLRHWQALTVEQKRAVLEIVSGPHARLAPANLIAGTSDGRPGLASKGIADASPLIAESVADIAKRLGRPLAAKVTLYQSTEKYKGTAYTFPYNAAGATPFDLAPGPRPPYGPMAECRITLTANGAKLSGSDPVEARELRASIQHEVFHCFTIELLGIDNFLELPLWLVEGAAAWVGESLVDGTALSVNWWPEYLLKPAKPLTWRSYDAIGLWSQLDAAGFSPWPLFDEMQLALRNGPAFRVMQKRAGDTFVASWPAGWVMNESFGPPWTISGPGRTYDKPTIDAGAVDNGGEVTLSTLPFANDLALVDLRADIVRIDATPATSDLFGVIHTSAGDTMRMVRGTHCARPGGCACPDGAARGDIELPRGPTYFAMTGHVIGMTASLHGMTLEDYCKRSPARTRITLSGALSETMQSDGSCVIDPSGTDASGAPRTSYSATFAFNAKGIVPIDSVNKLLLVQIFVWNYTGPGTYPAQQTYGAEVTVSGGLGSGWGVEGRVDAAVMINGDGSGVLSVTLPAFPKGIAAPIRVDGTFYCDLKWSW